MIPTRWLHRLLASPNRTARRAHPPARPRLLPLEDRTVPAGLSATLDAGNNLVVTDTAGSDNNFSVTVSGTTITIADTVDTFISAPLGWALSGDATSISNTAAVAGTITIDGAGGNDTYTTAVNQFPAGVALIVRAGTFATAPGVVFSTPPPRGTSS